MRGADQDSRALGAVYTPPALAIWAAQLLNRYLGPKKRGLILDPACGDGALLDAIRFVSPGYNLAGADIDARAVSKARTRLGDGPWLRKLDALAPFGKATAVESWRRLLRNESPIGLIANPPWGARVPHSREQLQRLGFTLAEGQFDSFEIFIELGLRLVRSGGTLVFIIPDSIFQPEHEPLRRLLCARTSIQLIARLGEGFFENVYRGTVVIAIKNELPTDTTSVACFRLTKQWRSLILGGKCSLAEAEQELAHYVPQLRFQTDSQTRFDIDLAEKERKRISVIESYVDGWTDWLISSRGVELSKTGLILRCPYCKCAHPLPHETKNMKCVECDRRFAPKSVRPEIIVLPIDRSPHNWTPLIVGEDVDRYRAVPSRQIKPGVPGINYKPSAWFEGRKMVIRKTGVGIKAAIDESGALTNQVVFIYRMKNLSREPVFMLDYFLGVLCSRIMLAYYLKKYGECEWRSHPYMTQRIISELPVPNVREGTWQWRQAKAIAAAVGRRMKSKSSDADVLVDRLVAGLFEFTQSDCAWALRVLDQAQSLEPIRTLRLSESAALQPIRV